VGILTERDVLRGVATRCAEFVQATVAEEMSQPVITVGPDMTALAASELMTSKSIKRLLVVREEQPVGVVTQTDITSGLISMSPFRNIAELMTRELVTVNETATMAEAAQRMAAGNVSCVVVLRAGRAVGIATEKDILRRVALPHEDPETTPVVEIMSAPVATVSPDYSVMSASRVMDQMHIHRLLIGNTTDDIRGIVTQTDIIAAVRKKLEEARSARLQHESEMGQLANSAMSGLSSIQRLLRAALCHRGHVGEPAVKMESTGSASSDRSAVLKRGQDEAAWHDSVLEELETQISKARDSLKQLTGAV
jgi:predicted transcriptional regulator